MLESSRDLIEAVGLLALIYANLRKIYVLQRNTRRWNGLGRAIRAEKAMYVLLFAWLLLMGIWPVLNDLVVLIVIATLVVSTELRVVRMMPRVVIRHTARDGTP